MKHLKAQIIPALALGIAYYHDKKEIFLVVICVEVTIKLK